MPEIHVHTHSIGAKAGKELVVALQTNKILTSLEEVRSSHTGAGISFLLSFSSQHIAL
jgi:hypothetical protein